MKGNFAMPTVSGCRISASEDVSLWRANEGVSLTQVEHALKRNGRDEIVFRAGDDVYILQATTLNIAGRWGRARAGETIEVAGFRGTVLRADNEVLGDAMRFALTALSTGMTAPLGMLLAALGAGAAMNIGMSPDVGRLIVGASAAMLGTATVGGIVAGHTLDVLHEKRGLRLAELEAIAEQVREP